MLRSALAILHAPAYEVDHRSALSADWAHLPIPKDAALLERLAESGDLVAHLLNTDRDASDDVAAMLGQARAARLAAVLALSPGLDEFYSETSEDAFAAEELGIER